MATYSTTEKGFVGLTCVIIYCLCSGNRRPQGIGSTHPTLMNVISQEHLKGTSLHFCVNVHFDLTMS